MDEIPAQPAAEPVPLSWPAADPGSKGLRKIPRRALAISIATTALVVVGGAVLAGAVAAAPDNGPPTPGAPGQAMPGPMMQNGNRAHMAGPGRAVHGEYTVPNGNGGYRTEEMQRGSITAVNGSTFTVKSEDGYTHDWVTDSNTGYGMRRGDTNSSSLTTSQNVVVLGTKDGDTFHAERVLPMRQFNGDGAQQSGPEQSGPQGGKMGGMPYRGGKFGHRGGGGGMPGFGGMQNGPAPMPQGGAQSAPLPYAPDQTPAAPDQVPAPDSSPTPTQAS
jgi:hypothetical protein